MSVKYANFGQVGAMGDHAQAQHFSQLWQGSQGNIDLRTLAVELTSLQEAMRYVARTDNEAKSVSAVVDAKNAASAGEGASALAALARAGKWALDVAEKIGVNLAAATIKTSLGL